MKEILTWRNETQLETAETETESERERHANTEGEREMLRNQPRGW